MDKAATVTRMARMETPRIVVPPLRAILCSDCCHVKRVVNPMTKLDIVVS